MQYIDIVGGSEFMYLCYIVFEGYGVFENMGGLFIGVNVVYIGCIGLQQGVGGVKVGVIVVDEDDVRIYEIMVGVFGWVWLRLWFLVWCGFEGFWFIDVLFG